MKNLAPVDEDSDVPTRRLVTIATTPPTDPQALLFVDTDENTTDLLASYATKTYVDTAVAPISTMWTPATGWTDFASTYTGLYCTAHGGMVTLEGLIKPTANTSPTIGQEFDLGTVPDGYRPAHQILYVSMVSTAGGATTAYLMRQTVYTSGRITGTIYTAATIQTAGWVPVNITYRKA